MRIDRQQGILYATIVGMEGCLIYVFMTIINRQVADGSMFIPGIISLLPLSFGVNLLIQRLKWRKPLLHVLRWLLWVAVMLLVVKIQLYGNLTLHDPAWINAVQQAMAQIPQTVDPVFPLIISSGLIWWLGWRLTYIRVSFAMSVAEFQVGLVTLLITLIVTSELTVSLTNPVPTTVAFFAFALTGMSIAHAQEGTGWLAGLYHAHWQRLLAISICVILVIGVLVGSAVNHDFVQTFINVLKWIWEGILKLLALIASLFPMAETTEPPPDMPIMPDTEQGQEGIMWKLPEEVMRGLRIGWIVLLITIIIFGLWRLLSQVFSWLRRRLTSMAGAEVEHVPGNFGSDFLSWLKRMLLKLFRIRLPSRLAGKTTAVLPEIGAVRQTYRQLLKWAADAGCPRSVSQTPHEYLSSLVNRCPEAEVDLDLVTHQYVRVRYSETIPSDDELSQLKECWYRIKQNRLKKIERGPTKGEEG